MPTERAAFLSFKSWRMVDSSPTFGLTARIVWRPVAVCAFEIIIGERGLCSLPIYKHADNAKEDAWRLIAALEKSHAH